MQYMLVRLYVKKDGNYSQKKRKKKKKRKKRKKKTRSQTLKPNKLNKTGHDSNRDVFIHWSGPQLSPIKKAKKKANIGQVDAIMRPNHSQLEALSKNNFNEATILERSGPLSGSHVLD